MVLLRPREGRPPPDPVASASYFSTAELDRARRFRRGQRALGLAASAIEAGLLVAAARRPQRWAGPLSSAGRDRPVAASALAGAGLALAADARHPAAGRARPPAGAGGGPRDPGLARLGGRPRQGRGARRRAGGGRLGGDRRAAAARRRRAGGCRAPASRSGRPAWAPSWPRCCSSRCSCTSPRSRTRRCAPTSSTSPARPGVTVGSVLVADASRKTSGANAYVSGLGATRRVVLFDTLLRDFSPEEVRLVVAHELSHVRHRDVLRTLGLLAAAVVARRRGGRRRHPSARAGPRGPPGARAGRRGGVGPAGPERGAAVAGGRGARGPRRPAPRGRRPGLRGLPPPHRRSRTSASPTRRAGPG